MKKLFFYLTIILSLSFLFSSTSAEAQEVKEDVITKRIAYDVTITGDNFDERHHYDQNISFANMPESDLELLRVKLFDKVLSGEIPAYYFDYENQYENFEIMPRGQLQENLENKWKLYFTLQETLEDGSLVDITIPEELSIKSIRQLRFLEEWYYEDGEFCKKVIAVAPVFIHDLSNDKSDKIIPYWVFMKDLME